jgi:hypothetical protein
MRIVALADAGGVTVFDMRPSGGGRPRIDLTVLLPRLALTVHLTDGGSEIYRHEEPTQPSTWRRFLVEIGGPTRRLSVTLNTSVIIDESIPNGVDLLAFGRLEIGELRFTQPGFTVELDNVTLDPIPP